MAKQFVTYHIDQIDKYNNFSGGTFRLLLILMREAEYPNSKLTEYSSVNTIRITPLTKIAWAVELELSVSSVNNSLTELVKANIVRKIDVGTYLLNPAVAYKGPAMKENEAVKQYEKHNRETN